LLKLLSRITAPTNGRAVIHGRVASLLEVGTGFNYELTGRENVYLNGSILGLKQREIDARYDRIAEFAEIPDFMDTPVKRYSSGMRVRLAFAVAAHLEPEILILDEVLAVGDAKFQEKCLRRIDEIKDSGVTILFVSHSTESVLKLCTRGILLQDGRLVAQGDVRDVVRQYTGALGLAPAEDTPAGFRESYVGIYGGNIAQRLLREFPEGRIAFDVPVETGDGVVAVDVGWVSTSRLRGLRTRPTWSGAPDVSVCIISKDRSETEASRAIGLLMRAGATESWIVMPDGKIRRYLMESRDFLGTEPMDNAMQL
jgi:ABC-type polysaccharide/polyol phosphate transport system ATPase subunit